MYKTFRCFVGTQVTFWKWFRLGSLNVTGVAEVLSSFLSSWKCVLKSSEDKQWDGFFCKCKIKTRVPSIYFLSEEKHIWIYYWLRLQGVLLKISPMKSSLVWLIDSLLAEIIFSTAFSIDEEIHLLPDFTGWK